MNENRHYITIPAYFNFMKLQWIPEHKISYLEWGGPKNDKVVVCVHGLTRNAYDFENLGELLARNFRVIAIDMPGRGSSDWFINKNHYNYPAYVKDLVQFIKLMKLPSVYWVGTSMGGLLGMCLATYYPKYIKAMVINDVGPEIPNRTLDRIRKYTGQQAVFNSFTEGQQFMKIIFKYFGVREEIHWRRLAETTLTQGEDGKYRLNYDVGVTEKATRKNRPEMLDLWYLWKKISCPVLLIHGKQSDVLLSSTIEKMRKYREFDLHTIQEAGHAPALIYERDLKAIEDWLNASI